MFCKRCNISIKHQNMSGAKKPPRCFCVRQIWGQLTARILICRYNINIKNIISFPYIIVYTIWVPWPRDERDHMARTVIFFKIIISMGDYMISDFGYLILCKRQIKLNIFFYRYCKWWIFDFIFQFYIQLIVFTLFSSYFITFLLYIFIVYLINRANEVSIFELGLNLLSKV